MASSSKPVIRFTDTSLRDAHQSLWATRMRTEDILGIAQTVDQAGYYSLECWGGATFDVCLRFLRENPWERLRLIKSACQKTPLQMLLRGQNILGYRNYADDVLERFVALSCENGIDIFRIFDALNDTRNLEKAIAATKKYGGHAQGTISYTVSPVHTVEKYVAMARELKSMGADTLCIKDMAGILTPTAARTLIGALVKEVKLPIQVHSHMTSGMAPATYMAAVEAGAGAIDCAVATLSGISSQPAVETMAAIFEDAGYETGLNHDLIHAENAYFKQIKPKREPKSSAAMDVVDVDVLEHHIPGGMISNLRSQLAQQDALDRLPEVLEELPKTRADMGYPPLVTPTSQIMGVQAVLNVLAGKRYEMVTQETRDYVKGLYGRAPAAINAKIITKILGKEKPITCRPADLLKPGLPAAAAAIPTGLIQAEEDILSYCLFPEVALGYFKWRAAAPEARDPVPADLEMQSAVAEAEEALEEAISEEIQRHADIGRAVAGFFAQLGLAAGVPVEGAAPVRMPAPAAPAVKKAAAPVAAAEPEVTNHQTINATLTGTFFRSDAPGKPEMAAEGAALKAGQAFCVIEAMKLFNPVKADKPCRIVKFLVKPGDHVSKGQPLVAVEY